ncbi:TPA: hypothetical protein MYL91_000617 [Klebsiella pneumoniae]|uniref:hypothetical protein n=1 Tax=Klebsiella pneumoniae TaxID=573 RepID=UPI00190BF20C|nr:hypothetical protein [Klebsiella pneumoniae]HCA9977659.1 hypothetical protein [Klebsiella pneumoniae]HCB0142390.1 hypothetical protein [Klebsiella pneumoniae]HCB0242407.1 hypothetical protein [Klebsiella pneumoniae]HCB0289021.1 hypothetical protein [Klebsiella pneumoniae]HCB0683014.1 hypothetical protein [Klebsiella pneumoniae]
MKDLLKSTIDALSIMHINIRKSSFSLSDEYNSLNFNSLDKKTQSFRRINKIEAIELVHDDESVANELFYSYHYSVGLRFIENTETEHHDDETGGVIFSIEATFEAIYRSKRTLTKEELEEFGKQNVGFNVWPFWREYVQSSTSRMGINSITVPFFKFNRSDMPSLE